MLGPRPSTHVSPCPFVPYLGALLVTSYSFPIRTVATRTSPSAGTCCLPLMQLYRPCHVLVVDLSKHNTVLSTRFVFFYLVRNLQTLPNMALQDSEHSAQTADKLRPELNMALF